MKKRDIDALIVIGGDGSLRGAEEFARETGFPVIGIPATIENDIWVQIMLLAVIQQLIQFWKLSIK